MTIDKLTAPKSLKQKIWIVLALAIPAMIENILQTIVGFVDTLFVAKIGLNEVTAVGIANTILAVYIAVLMAISIGTSSLISRKVGAEDYDSARMIAKKATVLSILFGLLFGLVTLLFAEPLLKVMGTTDEVTAIAATYFKIVGIPSFLIALMFTFGSILRAAGDTITPMKVGVWMNIIHLVLDYILIFGIGPMTGLGVAGAALATVISRFISVLMLYKKVQATSLGFSLFKKEPKDQWSLELIKLSTPTAIERLIMRFGQVFYFGLIVQIGTNTFAAHSIAGNIETFAYMPGLGLAVAATILVGQLYGAGKFKEAKEYGYITTAIGMVIMSVLGAILYFAAPWLASLFTKDVDTQDMIVTALHVSAISQPILAVGLILAGALQAIGDTKSPLYSTAIGMWFIRILGVYILGIHLEMGIFGVWLSIAIDLLIRAIFLAWKYQAHFKKLLQEK